MTAPENLEPVIQQKDELEEEKAPARKKPAWLKRRGALVFNLAVFAVVALLLGGAGMLAFGPWAIPFALVLGAFAANAVHIAFVWERAVILRFGNFSRIAEPGLYFTIPIVEQIALHVDQRINATSFLNERALTSDLAPVDVDASRVVRPGHPEGDRPLRLHEGLHHTVPLILRVLADDELQALQNLQHRLMKFPLVRVPGHHLGVDPLQIFTVQHTAFPLCARIGNFSWIIGYRKTRFSCKMKTDRNPPLEYNCL